jgi:hypothetical protein
MKLRSVLIKILPFVLATSFAGVAFAAGGGDKAPSADKPKVDCQKHPTNPDCKGKNG